MRLNILSWLLVQEKEQEALKLIDAIVAIVGTCLGLLFAGNVSLLQDTLIVILFGWPAIVDAVKPLIGAIFCKVYTLCHSSDMLSEEPNNNQPAEPSGGSSTGPNKRQSSESEPRKIPTTRPGERPPTDLGESPPASQEAEPSEGSLFIDVESTRSSAPPCRSSLTTFASVPYASTAAT